MVYNGTTDYEGVRLLRFVLPYSAFANYTDNHDNLGFCTPDVEHCIPSGAYNLTSVNSK